MAANAPDSPTASATSQELQLFPELGLQVPVTVAQPKVRAPSAARQVRTQRPKEPSFDTLWQFEDEPPVDSLPGLGQILMQAQAEKDDSAAADKEPVAADSPGLVENDKAAEGDPVSPPWDEPSVTSKPEAVEEETPDATASAGPLESAAEQPQDAASSVPPNKPVEEEAAAGSSEFGETPSVPDEGSPASQPETKVEEQVSQPESYAESTMKEEASSESVTETVSGSGDGLPHDEEDMPPAPPRQTADKPEVTGSTEEWVDEMEGTSLPGGEPVWQDVAAPVEEDHDHPLPKELRYVAGVLEKSMKDPAALPGAFASFCAAAYVKPEWAGAASDYLITLFEDQQDLLAEMTRVPDLIIELGTGHYTLTFMVASHWAERVDLSRLTRLAEALVAAHSKLGSPEVVDLMLALTTSLAISRFPRAEQLLAAAEAHAAAEHDEALREARLWLGAGRIVRSCNQDARDLWDQRLRRPRTAWGWNSREEVDALAQLSQCLDTQAPSAQLFQAVVPACWWALQVDREQERTELEASLKAVQTVRPPEPLPELPREVVRQPIIIWRGVPFFIGGLVGAWALLLGIWLSPYDLVRSSPETADAQTVANQGQAAEGSQSSPAAVAPPAAPEHPNAVWRREQAAQLAKEAPELRPLVEKIEFGEWPQHEALLEGLTPELPKDDPHYQKLLLWLHLDPPSNAEIRKQVPHLLAELRQDSTVLDLWEKLVYPGSLNAAAIQEAAMRTLHENKDSWSATQRALLTRIGTLPLTPAPQAAATGAAPGL